MRIARTLALVGILALVASVFSADSSRAQTAKEGTQAAAAAGGQSAPFPCKDTANLLEQSSPAQRTAVAASAIARRCQPLPETLWTSLRLGQWPDKVTLSSADRESLLVMSLKGGYAPGESLAVTLIETGTWPDGRELSLNAGAEFIRFLGPALTTYRVRLLLDVFEQTGDYVRLAVLQALSQSKIDEALLPALEAYWRGQGPLQQQAYRMITRQPEKTPDETLARLVRKLPQGPLLKWALQMAQDHPSAAVDLAKKARGVE